MVTAATEHFASERIIPLLFIRNGKPLLDHLNLVKKTFLNNGRMVIGYDEPFVSVSFAASCTADFDNSAFADNIWSGIPFILQNAQDGGIAPYTATS